MYVFIDESGQFNAPRDIADIANYECIVAVALTDQVLEEIEEQFGDKDKEFLHRNAKDIIRILITRNCTAFAVIIDANSCTAATVQDHKADYINSISQSSLIYQPFLLESVNHHVQIFSSTSNNEYIQALLMIRLLENLLRGIADNSTQLLQHDLTCFNFTFDNTNSLIMPTVKYFSCFAIFQNSIVTPIEIDNKQHLSNFIDSSGKYINVQAMFSKINFTPSKDSMEVRIADVISNQIFRMLNGRIIDHEILVILRGLFSYLDYSFDALSFDLNHAFIESSLNEQASNFVKAVTEKHRGQHL